MRLLLFFLLSAAALTGCTKTSGPLKTYFIGSTRFTSGNRTAAPADTLAARVYIDDTNASPAGLANLRVTVDYSLRRAPFVYPTPISSFLPASVTPNPEQLVFMDSTFSSTNAPTELLYTALFGARTSAGNERWTFTATDKAGNSSARTFVVNQRRSDSTLVYNDYILRLNLPVTNQSARRFIDLKSGLALPSYTVANNPDLQNLTDLILLPSGVLSSPDAPGITLSASKWTTANRSRTRFSLTTLTNNGFTAIADTTGLRTQFVAPGSPQLNGLSVGQVYAFYTRSGKGGLPLYGLLYVADAAAGYRLQIRIAKRPL